jgi:microsomal dipeptidase-like Zn-dependent dipeptidase
MKKKVLIALAVIILVGLAVFFFVVPAQVEKSMNITLNPPPYRASERAGELHRKLFIVDLHADSLLWDRDLLERTGRGHVDVPRLIEGNVALQAFTIVTQTPRGQNIESNDDSTDNITLLSIAQRWPVAAWSSLMQRALYQTRRLREMAERSGGRFTVIKTASELASYLERRRSETDITAGFLGVEGAHALDGDLSNIDALFDAGIRMMAPTHFFDNDLAGSAHGASKGGLTEKGREMIRRMEEKRMIVDLAHASPQTIDDVLAMVTRPVVVSHTGVKGTCDNQRNLSDEHIKAIARRRGVIGIGYWDTATCGRDAKAIARAISYTVRLVGIDHVGLGSDYDGGISAPFDTTGIVEITDALLEEGFSHSDIEKIMGGNVLRLLLENLP